MPSILIGADLVPAGRMRKAFEAGDAEAIFGDLLEAFRAADLAIANLECPLIREETPVEKTGPVLGAPVGAVRGVANAGLHVLNLANNHILDHGPQGLGSTLDACRDAGLQTVGAGENAEAAARLLVRRAGDLRVGILGLAEHEFSIAGRDSPGANGLDLARFMRTVRAAVGTYDFLLVLLHGGSEHCPYPSPRLMETCRFLVEEGAGAVVCQHSHCAGCWESYRGAPIVYGQGNLLFDEYPRQPAPWCEGFLVRLEVGRDRRPAMEIIPLVQSDERPGARRMEPDRERGFRQALEERSAALADEAFVRAQWDAFCRTRENVYLSLLHGHGPFLRRVHARVGWLRWWYSRPKRLLLLNLVRCEAHREVIQTLCR